VVKVGVVMPTELGDAAEFLADVRALEAAGADMIAVEGGQREADDAVLGAIAAITHRVRLRVADGQAAGVLDKLSRGRVVAGEPDGEAWVEVPMPPDRESWAAMLREKEAAGAHGVIVRWDPRVIDLLRNPEPEDRSDLLMSTG
jgi:hypothetical protein